jgi:hypothetical protein
VLYLHPATGLEDDATVASHVRLAATPPHLVRGCRSATRGYPTCIG